MCYILFQIYACGHQKPVCITPCPHAHATSRPWHQESTPRVSRSASAPSIRTTAPTPSARRSNTTNTPHQGQSPSPADSNMPSRVVASWPPVGQKSAFPVVVTQSDTVTRLPAYAVPDGASRSITPMPALSREPSSRMDSTVQKSQHGREVLSSSERKEDYGNMKPNLCTYYFPHYLRQGRVSCLSCYFEPEWSSYRQAWMTQYQDYHCEADEDELDELRGIPRVKKRVRWVEMEEQPEREGGGD